MLIPVLVLLLLDRGMSIAEVGLASAAQGLMVMALELPTGALADSHGRRAVLLSASLFDLASIGLLLTADSIGMLVLVFALQGVYRALESGPLDAWFVDSTQAVDPTAKIEDALGAAGAVLGASIAVATVGAGALVALDPVPGVDPLMVPLLVSLVLRMLNVVAIAVLMTEPGRPIGRNTRVTGVIGDSLHLIRASRMLQALMVVELLWGAGMVAFETLTPARLEEVTGSAAQAAAIFGPVTAVAWLSSAGAAAVVPRLAIRVGATRAGALLRIVQGITVAGIGISSGAVGVIIAFLLTMAVHGAANPVHQGLLHRSVDGPANRSTVVSANSLSAQFGGALGMIALTSLADATTRSTAIVTGAVLLAAAAPVYLIPSTRPPRR